jgi:hypothetical protein
MKKSDLIKRRKELDARHQAKPVEGGSIVRQFGTVKDGRAVIATETPIDIYDQDRGWIKQVLLMDGVRFRNDKKAATYRRFTQRQDGTQRLWLDSQYRHRGR